MKLYLHLNDNRIKQAIIKIHGYAWYQSLLRDCHNVEVENKKLKQDQEMLNNLIELMLERNLGISKNCHDDTYLVSSVYYCDSGDDADSMPTPREAITAAIKEWRKND